MPRKSKKPSKGEVFKFYVAATDELLRFIEESLDQAEAANHERQLKKAKGARKGKHRYH